MSAAAMTRALWELHRATLEQDGSGLSDADLLDAFLLRRDEIAFEALLRRHGPLVLGVCRRLLRTPHDAADAFQAVFLVFVQKARSIRCRATLGAWFYGVAYRLCLKARARQHRRQTRETTMPDVPETSVERELPADDLLALLDAELNALPEKYRVPVVLCELQGRSRREAAQALEIPEGTLSSRLATARKMLRERLQRRGVVLSAGALTAALSPGGALASVPPVVAASTVKGAVLVAAGKDATALISETVATLAEGMLKSMFLAKLRTATVLIAMLALLGVLGAALAARAPWKLLAPGSQAEESLSLPQQPPQGEREQKLDRWGDPLPPEALARLGTNRFRQGNFITAAAVSPDGKTVVSVGGNSPIHLWDLETGKEIRRLEGHGCMADAVAFSPNGRWVASGANDGTVGLWEVATGKKVRTIQAKQARVLCLAFSPDGKLIASSGRDPTILLSDVETGKETRTIVVLAGGIKSLAFSPDGKFLASGGWDRNGLRIRDAASGKEIEHLLNSQQPIGAVAFSPDGKTLASGGGTENELLLWEVGTWKRLHRLTGLQGEIDALAFSPDSKLLVSGGKNTDHLFHVWERATGKEVCHCDERGNRAIALSFTGDGKRVVVGTGGSLRVWDVETRKEVSPVAGHTDFIASVSVSPDGQMIATAGGDWMIYLWERKTGKILRGLAGHRGDVRTVAFSPDGRTLASGSNDKTVRLWNVRTGEETACFRGHTGLIYPVAWSPDGQSVASGDYYDGTVILWEASSGKQLRTFRHPCGTMCLAFSPEGTTLAVGPVLHRAAPGDRAAAIRIWDVESGKESRPLAGHEDQVSALAYSPNGKCLASGGADRLLCLWDVSTGARIWQQETGKWGLNALAFSPDGKTLAWGDHDPAIHLMEVATKKDRRVFQGHRAWPHALTFSRDGRLLVSGSMDTTAVLWDVTAGFQKARAEGPALEDLWERFESDNAEEGYNVLWSLVHAEKQVDPFLRKKLQPVEKVSPQKLKDLIADLDHGDFSVRAKAAKELENLGEQAKTALQTLPKTASAEVQRRVAELLEGIDDPTRTAEKRQAYRAIEVLELRGTTEAKEILQTLANGAPEAPLTQEARKSLDRLTRRQITRP
jgi:RNA polymerase sigma factor (sigma-70 family)